MPGDAAVQLARPFSAFDRHGLASGPVEGTGIGLVISRRRPDLVLVDLRPSGGSGLVRIHSAASRCSALRRFTTLA
jgi:ActR/RegA family two-component response regulator